MAHHRPNRRESLKLEHGCLRVYCAQHYTLLTRVTDQSEHLGYLCRL